MTQAPQMAAVTPLFNKRLTDELRVSAAAREKLLEVLRSEDEEFEGVRLFVTGGGCGGMSYGMTFADRRFDTDCVLEQSDLKVFVDAVALSYLKGVEIDFVEDLGGGSFVFNNVFATTGGTGTCGACGAAGGGCA